MLINCCDDIIILFDENSPKFMGKIFSMVRS